MKAIFTLIIVSYILSQATFAKSITAQCDQLHSVLYAGGKKQPILRIKVTADENGQCIKTIAFNMTGTTTLNNLSTFALYYSGSKPFFAPTSGLSMPASLTLTSKASGILGFNGKQFLETGNNYFWLVGSVNNNARGNNKVDASCLAIETAEGEKIVPDNAAPEGTLTIYPYQFRICPYYRSDFHMQWNPDLLTEKNFSTITDLIYFSVSVDNEGNVIGADAPHLLKGIDSLKKLRDNKLVNLIIGVTPNAKIMSGVAADETRRKTFASQLAQFVKEQSLQGIDIDWEYPGSNEDWNNYALLLNDIREAVGASGVSLSIATAMYYKPAPSDVFDQLDFLNNMSYDARGEHSTMDLMKKDIELCQKAGMPDYKIIAGLPFYSCETRSNRNWDEQQGYDSIIKWFPNISPSENTFTSPNTKEKHYFNGINLIKEKAKYVRENMIGGVMIWAYDRDVPLNNNRSLTKALFTVLKPIKR